jgi:HEAT repeat protein
MTEQLGRRPGLVLVALAAVLGACPAARAQGHVDEVVVGDVVPAGGAVSAAQALAQRDVDRELREIREGWNDGSPASRERAFERMAALGADASPALPLLIGALRDPSPPIRARAADCIGRIGSAAKESVPALTALLKDPEAAVRDAAATALARFGRRAAGSIDAMVESLRAPADRRCPGVALALARIGEPVARALIDLLKADDPALRRAVIEGIEKTAQSGSWDEARAVARAVGPLYWTLARDPEPGVRVALASMLVTTRSGSTLEIAALGGLLRDPHLEVRLAVTQAVGGYDHLPNDLRVAFLELLKDGDGRVRAAAAKAIPQAELAAAPVIDRLLIALEDPDSHVRVAAAEKLAAARSTDAQVEEHDRLVLSMWTSAALAHHPAAARILASALDDTRPGVRAAAAHLLPAFRAEAVAAVPRLTERLRDPTPAVRAAAAEALTELGPASRPAVRALLGMLANPDDASQEGRLASFNAAKALAAIGGDARAKMLRVLIGQLNSLDDGVRQRAEQIVVALGPKVAGDLFRILSDSRSPHRVQAEVQGLLYTLLQQDQSRHVFCASPSRPEVVAARPVMRSLARDADPEVQIAALAVLAAIEPEATEAADAYLDHVRSGANPDLDSLWLAQVVQPAMIPTLIKGLKDQDAKVRLATANTLSTLAERLSGRDQADQADSSQSEAEKVRSSERRRQLKVQAARALLSSLGDPDDRVRWITAETLGVLHVEARVVVPTLIEMVKTATGRVPPDDIAIRSFQEEGQPYLLGANDKTGDPLRIAAIQALGSFGREAAAAVPQLVRALRDKDSRVRWFAAEALGLIGPDAKAGVPALVEALRSRDVATGKRDDAMEDGPIRLIAALGLGKIGPEARAAIPELIAALSGPDSRVRGEAAQALGLIGPEAHAAVPELIRLMLRETVNDVAERAKEALARLGVTAAPAVTELLHDRDPEVRAKAVEILGQMDATSAVPIPKLVRCLHDRDAGVRTAAANALASAGDRAGAAIPPLVIALMDRETGVSQAARAALAAIGKSAQPSVFAMWDAAATRAVELVERSGWVVVPLEP